MRLAILEEVSNVNLSGAFINVSKSRSDTSKTGAYNVLRSKFSSRRFSLSPLAVAEMRLGSSSNSVIVQVRLQDDSVADLDL